jgi:Zn-dependent protease
VPNFSPNDFMTPHASGSIKLFRLAGITVFLHWSWFIVAMIEFTQRTDVYTSRVWNVFEYISLFLIVMIHEFGHSLACRSVGGRAEQIVLWPLGGVAYVSPPPRPGAQLWSIAAGPLVNVVLVPVLFGCLKLSTAWGWTDALPDAHNLLRSVFLINMVLLIFNMLPVFPLDGGQILRSLLWFVVGRNRSLMIASIVGLVGAAGLVALAVWMRSIWTGLVAGFILMNCWNGFKQSRAMSLLGRAPKHSGFACPSCKAPPLQGLYWLCHECRQPFDVFEGRGTCPHCSATAPPPICLECGQSQPVEDWSLIVPVR